MAQRFVPNTSDLRVLVFNFKPVLALRRTRTSNDTHLNNTSQGAQAEIVKVEELPAEVIQIATEAAKGFSINMCGIDILQNSESKEWHLLEINSGPDITGAFFEEKAIVFNEFIKSFL